MTAQYKSDLSLTGTKRLRRWMILVKHLLTPSRMVKLLLIALGFWCYSTMTSSGHQGLPSVYEYFADGENLGGLTADSKGFFKLNGKPLRILSGTIHYFRIHPDQWRMALRKLRASGANTLETYVAWSLHEPEKDKFDFGDGDNDMSLFLDVRKFIKMAQEEDLLVILRPGPYICAEFDYGGLPSYLLRDPKMKVRTAYQPYLDRVKVYLDKVLPLVTDLQFTEGGSIIAVQIENEYGSFDTIELDYLRFVQKIYLDHGLNALHFTSDGSYNRENGTLPNVLKTINAQRGLEKDLKELIQFQPNKPNMIMEFWAGWFDHWFEAHSVFDFREFHDVLDTIMGPPYNTSVNLFVFQGGTNFGFMAGANAGDNTYQPDVTSYDYDAPLTEAGDYTEKYLAFMKLVEKYEVPKLRRPERPPESKKVAFSPIPIQSYLTFSDILDQVPDSSKFKVEDRIPMEHLPMNDENGQRAGYILYRKKVAKLNKGMHNFTAGPVKDFGILLVDGEIQPFPLDRKGKTKYWMNSTQEYVKDLDEGEHTFDLLIENMGRVNYGKARDLLQWKGLPGPALSPKEKYHLDGKEIKDVEIIALEFKSKWVKGLRDWRKYDGSSVLKGPLLLQFHFTIPSHSEMGDTFLDMARWTKGIVFINGFNLGRYWNVGPQQTLFLPQPFLRVGENTITVFEQINPGPEIAFSFVPNLGPIRQPEATLE